MKKNICFLLVFIMAFSFAACGKSKKTSGSSVDLEYYVKLGQIPECEYSIGANPEDIKTKLEAEAENDEHGHSVYDFVEGEEDGLIDGGEYNYLYKKANINNGISYIVSYDTAFGFEIGSVIVEIRDAFKGIEFKEEPLNDLNSFFLLGANDGVVLTTEISNYTVSFIFIDNALCATTVYKTLEWK